MIKVVKNERRRETIQYDVPLDVTDDVPTIPLTMTAYYRIFDANGPEDVLLDPTATVEPDAERLHFLLRVESAVTEALPTIGKYKVVVCAEDTANGETNVIFELQITYIF